MPGIEPGATPLEIIVLTKNLFCSYPDYKLLDNLNYYFRNERLDWISQSDQSRSHEVHMGMWVKVKVCPKRVQLTAHC